MAEAFRAPLAADASNWTSPSRGSRHQPFGGFRRRYPLPYRSLPPVLALLVVLAARCCSCRLAFAYQPSHFQLGLSALNPTQPRSVPLNPLACQRARGAPQRSTASDAPLPAEAASSEDVQASASDAATRGEAEAAATTSSGVQDETRSRRNVGQRRAEDRRTNWHRQYIYGPVDPTATLRRNAAAAVDAEKEAAKPPELLLQLSSQRRPAGRRWRLLEDLEAGEEILRAAGAAAKETLEAFSAAKQGTGPLKASRRKSRNSRTQQPTVSLQLQMRRAALKAAAEAVERAFRNMQDDPQEDGAAKIGVSQDTEALVTPDIGKAEGPEVLGGALGPRAVYAAELRRLLRHRAALIAAGVIKGNPNGLEAPVSNPKDTSIRTSGDPSCSSDSPVAAAANQSVTMASVQSGGDPSESVASKGRLPLLDALLPREGVKQRPSSALLTCQLLCTAGFDETIEVHVHLKRRTSKGGAATRAPNRVQGFAQLPHGVIPSRLSSTHLEGGDGSEAAAMRAREIRGKTKGGIWRRPRTIAALVEPSHEAAAKAAGADIIGIDGLLESLEKDGKRGPDVVICIPELMASLSTHGKALGRRNLIPSVTMGTLTEDPIAAIRLYRQPTIQFRADRLGVVHAPIGYSSMETHHLLANFHAFLDALKVAALASPQGGNSQGGGSLARVANCVHICSTMGPSLEIDARSC